MAVPTDASPIFIPRAAASSRRAVLRCDGCRTALPGAVLNTSESVACPACHASLLARVFPAMFRPGTGVQAAEGIASEEDASCFYHPRKKAVVPCGQCGRFLCSLCDLELADRHLCPTCVEAGRSAGGQTALRAGLPPPRRTLHDKVALSLAALPLLLWPCTLLTAPVALFLAIRYWNEPRSNPLPRGRWRLVVAGLLAFVQLAGWLGLLYFAVFEPRFFGR